MEKNHKEFFEKLRALLMEYDAVISHDGDEPIYAFFDSNRNIRFIVGELVNDKDV